MRSHPAGHLTARDFRSDRDKWLFIQAAPELDSRDYRVRRLADLLWEAAGQTPRAFAVLAQAYCRDVVRYMTDTDQYGEEDLSPGGQIGDVLERGVDDCDAKARLFVALCLAVKLRARVVPHWQGDELRHVSAEIVLHGAPVPVELTLARARLGENPRDVPKETTGHWALNEIGR